MLYSLWESIITVFASLRRFLDRWIPSRLVSQTPHNPYPFGTREWMEYAAAQATEHELMVLRIADLEAQVQQTGELLESLEALSSHQDTLIRDLKLQNKTLRDGPDPEVFERIWEDVHRPLKKPAQPGGPEPESSGSSSAPVASAAEPARASGGGPVPPSGTATETATGPRTVSSSQPLTLAEELEGQLDEDSEEELEEGGS